MDYFLIASGCSFTPASWIDEKKKANQKLAFQPCLLIDYQLHCVIIDMVMRSIR